VSNNAETKATTASVVTHEEVSVAVPSINVSAELGSKPAVDNIMPPVDAIEVLPTSVAEDAQLKSDDVTEKICDNAVRVEPEMEPALDSSDQLPAERGDPLPVSAAEFPVAEPSSDQGLPAVTVVPDVTQNKLPPPDVDVKTPVAPARNGAEETAEIVVADTRGEEGADIRMENKAVIVTSVLDSNGNAVILKEPIGDIKVDTVEKQPVLSPSSANTQIEKDGRKQYDRDFLLQLQTNPLSLQKPALPNLEIVLSSGSMRASASAPQLGDLQGAEYVRGSPARRESRRRELPPTAPPKKVISISREPVKLHQAEHAWTPGTKQKQDIAEALDELEILGKQVRAILNKLTPQKFDKLVLKFKELPIDTEEKLILCTDLVFEKALDEPGFSVAYARMCKVLSLKKVPKSDDATTEVAFRTMLINRCQKEFLKDYISEEQKSSYTRSMEAAASEDERKRLTEEFAQLEMRQRRRSLGNIRFIGELFKQEMMTGPIMHSIISKLLAATDEESLESLCSFLTTVGQILEEKTIANTKKDLEDYFVKMAEIIREKKTSSRVRFLMQASYLCIAKCHGFPGLKMVLMLIRIRL
jgi:translation initiation factor 4G